MADEIEKEVIDETKEEEIKDDKSGENKEEEDKGEKKEVETDKVDVEKLGPEKEEKKEEKEEEDDDTDPEDKARISKIVQKQVLTEVAKATELATFLRANPQFAKYEQVISLYKADHRYSNSPLKDIAAIVSYKDAEKIGAQKEREAQKKVAETKAPGTTVRKPDGGGTDWHNASKEDFENQKAKVLGRMGN